MGRPLPLAPGIVEVGFEIVLVGLPSRFLAVIRFEKPGDWAEIELPADIPPGRYEVFLFLLTSWDYGICRWSLNGNPLGESFDGHTQTVGMSTVPGGAIELEEGARILRAEAVGRADLSSGFFAGLDAVVLKPE